jgi:hypothetical protein
MSKFLSGNSRGKKRCGYVWLTVVLLINAPLCAGAGTASNGWVSGKGADITGCGPVTNPCRTFQYVHDNVVIAGGQIRVLDAAGYGPLNIRKAISVINDSVGVAGISAPSGEGIYIQAGTGEAILIKGISIDGVGTGSNGIHAVSAGRITVANCNITGFSGSSATGNGIFINPTTSGNTIQVNILDSNTSNNAATGVLISANANTFVYSTLKNVYMNSNGFGFASSGVGFST